MADRPAVDASPLIFLARARLLDLLRLIAEEIVVPRPVAAEIARRGPGDPAAEALARSGVNRPRSGTDLGLLVQHHGASFEPPADEL